MIDDIIQKSGNANVEIRQLDLASLSSVRNFAAGILQTESRLDVLINNAGCAGYAEKQLTEDGLEYQMQANYFGHFLLTNLLLGIYQSYDMIHNRSLNLNILTQLLDLLFDDRIVEEIGSITYS